MRAGAHFPAARAPRAAPDAAPYDRQGDRRPARDRPPDSQALHRHAAGARHPGRGRARRRRRLPLAPGLPAAPADVERRRGHRCRPRTDRRATTGTGQHDSVGRRRPRKDPPGAPRRAAPPSRGARDNARLHDAHDGRRAGGRRRGAAAGRRDPAATGRSQARRRSASSARTAWSSTLGAGTSRRTITRATTCAHSGSTACAVPP